MLSQTNINQSEKYFKKAIELIVYGHGFSCSQIKSSWSCHVKKKKIRSDEPTQRSKRLDKQGMLKEQITMVKNNIKRQMKSFALLIILYQGTKILVQVSLQIEIARSFTNQREILTLIVLSY
jgi:hypothetical protein